MVTVRPALDEDLALCAALPTSYTTRTAWQLAVDGDAGRAGPLHLSLQQVRLPRLLTLPLPSALIPLHETWTHHALTLVAEDEGGELCGYLCLQALPDQGQAVISRLLVDPPARGRGAGSALVRAAYAWAASQNMLRLLAHTPLRNTSGSGFYQRRGFRICGLSEHFYATREDALLLERWI